jgi:threonine/homoserine/homoserine lactone efflux protein
MTETTHLWLFFVLVFGVVLLPGLDMAYVLASALIGGRRAGMAATAGIVAGGVVHVTMGALGIMAVLRLFPAAFNAVLLAGALYIAWIGISLLRSRSVFSEQLAQPGRSVRCCSPRRSTPPTRAGDCNSRRRGSFRQPTRHCPDRFSAMPKPMLVAGRPLTDEP